MAHPYNIFRITMSYIIHQIAILSDYSNFTPPPTTDSVKKNIDGKYVLWKEKDIVSLISNKFNPNVLKAYNSLKSNALKADLARYCILYSYGGWYFDLLMTIDGSINHRLDDFDMLVFRDIPLGERSPLPISNSIIWVKQSQNKIIKRTIDLCVQNILNKSYPKTSHRITGPAVLGRAIAEASLSDDNINILVGDLAFENESGCGEFTIQSWYDRKRIHFGWHRLPGTEDHLPNSYQKGSLYDKLYNERRLYE